MFPIYINNRLHIPCRYRDGVYLRDDVFQSQLKVYLLGFIFENNDEYSLGMNYREYQHLFDSCSSIDHAIQISSYALIVQDFEVLIADEDVVYFLPQIVVIRDHDGRLVLAGKALLKVFPGLILSIPTRVPVH